jgi:nucleoid-associated protein EbfC
MDIKKLMQQAQKMQKQMKQMQDEIAKKQFEGKAGGGLVSVVMSGSGEMHKVNVDSSLMKPEENDGRFDRRSL